MAMITSQGQRLAQLEALLKENQTLRTDLATAQRRIKELESSVTPTITAPTPLDTPKPAGSEASKWKSSPASPLTIAPATTTPSFATVARRGKNATPAINTKTSTRARTAPTKRQIQVAARTFLPPSTNTGYQYLYLPCRFRESVTNVRKKFGMLGLENWRVLDIYHPTHRVVALLVHNEYASTVINKLDTAGIKQITDFNPRNPAHLRDIKYQDLSDTDKQTKMEQIHTSHLLIALDRMRSTVRPAVARDFINKKWITIQNYMDLLKKPLSAPSQSPPVDTDMDDAPLLPPASPKAAQPVPTGDGEPDEQL
ncbi:hypothetical protein G6F22_016164 [Rhizopus arrhizus]|nr:hypothetical protein G6F22_016164 [Rhizopus arrhizus]KAG0777616.1 hypothetical protein G6F21_013292 [Rhizopus arrhizus]KAG0803690.1 hypothetical protein G6F20_013300 [Rhizopus arrhizus]KAG0862979.1 hypothetical protein G6F15_013390 [Rhizopus arrhizus]KAG0937841.1 hypothetical protein G6F31_015538 [Rhizopus arrhizus]